MPVQLILVIDGDDLLADLFASFDDGLMMFVPGISVESREVVVTGYESHIERARRMNDIEAGLETFNFGYFRRQGLQHIKKVLALLLGYFRFEFKENDMPDQENFLREWVSKQPE